MSFSIACYLFTAFFRHQPMYIIAKSVFSYINFSIWSPCLCSWWLIISVELAGVTAKLSCVLLISVSFVTSFKVLIYIIAFSAPFTCIKQSSISTIFGIRKSSKVQIITKTKTRENKEWTFEFQNSDLHFTLNYLSEFWNSKVHSLFSLVFVFVIICTLELFLIPKIVEIELCLISDGYCILVTTSVLFLNYWPINHSNFKFTFKFQNYVKIKFQSWDLNKYDQSN